MIWVSLPGKSAAGRRLLASGQAPGARRDVGRKANRGSNAGEGVPGNLFDPHKPCCLVAGKEAQGL